MNEVTHQTRSRFTYCSLPPGPVGLHSLGFTGPRMESIIVNKSKWVNGTDLRYYFFDRDTDGENVVLADGSTEWRTWTTDDAHKDLVREAFESWKAVGLGLRFLEEGRREDAEVRIGFMLGDGSWSYLGKDVLERGTNERTMNFGWDLVHHRETPDRDTRAVPTAGLRENCNAFASSSRPFTVPATGATSERATALITQSGAVNFPAWRWRTAGFWNRM